MAVPKKKTTPCKRGMRNAHNRVHLKPGVECSNCGLLKRPHHVCFACGYYNGKRVIISKEEKRRAKEEE